MISSCPDPLQKKLHIYITFGYRLACVDTESSVSHLNRQPVLKIKQTDLTHILQLAISLTHFSLLIPSISPRPPTEHGKRSNADFTLLFEIGLCHAHVGIVAQATVASDGEIRALPTIRFRDAQHLVRHGASILPLFSRALPPRAESHSSFGTKKNKNKK